MRNENPDIILSIRDLSVNFGKKKVLDKVTLQFERGEAVLIAGNNGSGKSTLLRCMAGIYWPESGTIRSDPSIPREKIGFISDKMSLFESMTLREGIDFHCRVFKTGGYDDSLLKPLKVDMSQPIRSLSAGERALYHLSLVLSQKPGILLVDEIIHTIDPYLREIFLEALIDLIDQYGTTILMVNHTFSEMGRIPERILILENGWVILDEKSEELNQKIKKIILEEGQLPGNMPVIFKKKSPLGTEYTVYPYSGEFESQGDFEFQDVDLTEIIKSFIGGYYDKKRE